MQKVSVIGLGYVGLPLLVAIAESRKYDVVGFDISEKTVKSIQKGKSPFKDNDVDNRLSNLKVKVSSNPNILKNSDIFIIAVPTPVKTDYEPDLGPITSASETISKYLTKDSTVIVESTINPGVCKEIVLPILEKNTDLKGGKDFELAHCPERINPGDSKWNVYNIPRNVGALTKNGTKKVAEFYRSFLSAEINEVGSIKVAEASKIVENTFRDINIAYVNELAKSFDSMGIDLIDTLNAASNKPFGFMPHWPGCGVGGHCIAVDPYYLITRAALSGFDHKFLKIAREINNSMPEYTVQLLIKELNKLGKPLKGTKVFLYGLSYKANVGDLRESPALEIRDLLIEMGAKLLVYDPYVKQKSNTTLENALKESVAMIVASSHEEIINLKPKKFKHIKILIDGRNCLDKEEIEKSGIIYKGIGR